MEEKPKEEIGIPENLKEKDNFNRVWIKFKNGKELSFDIIAREGMKEKLEENWATCKREGIIPLGDYLITTDEVLWINIKAGKSEELSGK